MRLHNFSIFFIYILITITTDFGQFYVVTVIVIRFFKLRVIVIVIVTDISQFRVIVIVIGTFNRVTRDRDRDCDEALVFW